MKYIISLLSLLSILSGIGTAQSFEEGLELYRAEEFEEAYQIFTQLDDDRSVLFAGKSMLALDEPATSINYFNSAEESSIESVRQEAIYSRALAHYRLKNYDLSLFHLREVLDSDDRTAIRRDAQRLYNQLLQFLSESQRFEVLYRSESPSVRYDLVRNSRNRVNDSTYQFMVSEFLKTIPDSNDQNRIERELLSLRASGGEHETYPDAPGGTVFNIGVILPTFDPEDPDFAIPRNLYYGMMLAADEFNSRNSEKKVRLIFRNSAENPDTTAAALTELVWTRQIDAVMGPLFSQPAYRMASLSEEYRIPMLAPLANSDDLNLDYNFTFQINPTFEVHGKIMARYAIEELGLDNLAIITETGSLGKSSAVAFRREAERLGAHITYYIEEDFEATGFDISQYTEVFAPDAAQIDSLGYTPSQAVYAPFTGQAAPTLINLFLNDLEAMRSNVVVLGSEEWANISLTDFQRQQFEIYYTQSFGEAADSETIDFFTQDYETRFGNTPDRFSKLGYDTANILFESLETAGNPYYLARVIRSKTGYNGLSLRVDFDGNRINQHVYIRPLTVKARERTGDF